MRGSSIGVGVTPRHVTLIVLGLIGYTFTAFGGMSGGWRHVRSAKRYKAFNGAGKTAAPSTWNNDNQWISDCFYNLLVKLHVKISNETLISQMKISLDKSNENNKVYRTTVVFWQKHFQYCFCMTFTQIETHYSTNFTAKYRNKYRTFPSLST